ncbi:protein TONSOKU [Sesamum angolense]|uniref:Protein TONSOKU n=1 Tax=Sesamum angolense TaxID=2727404 RepID=A0AAE2BQI5_9LAMI|nr:protein TONSOKU [Sesamum angolense]
MPRKEEATQQQQLTAAKRAYNAAVDEGNRQEEARWANVIGDILKNRGEYVEALRWLRKDYEVSLKYLPDKQLLATCGVSILEQRVLHFSHAYTRPGLFLLCLFFLVVSEKKHLELAKDQNDLIEQQRASTQLGRTYHEMFLKSDDDHCSVRNAKKYFKFAMKLARIIKENPPTERVSFIKEYIDAHNLGMLEIDLDNLDEAEKILSKGLEICDEEEVGADDDARSRLHHNLGNVYLELRQWEKAHEHIKKDIVICKNIGHCQGEAKGFVNLGELHYRIQRYAEAIASYQKALDLAKSLEDEHALADQIGKNIETLREYGKKKKRIASELCDKEKLSDSFLVIGESYQNLRKFGKALKWYRKGWETYRLIGNLEGQALAKINIGDVLDSSGDWEGALGAFQEGYRQVPLPYIFSCLFKIKMAVKGNLPSLQLSALENMHYSYMIRFDDAEEARRAKLLIDKLKQSKKWELKPEGILGECCSETKTDLDNLSTDDRSDGSFSPKKYKPNLSRVKSNDIDDDLDEHMPLVSLLQSVKRIGKQRTKQRTACGSAPNASSRPCGSPTQSISRSTGSFTANRKRVRVILSDDEGENEEDSCSRRMVRNCAEEGIATSGESLYSLDITNCSITSRTVQKVADSLDSESVLTHLCIGRNHPVSGNAIISLLLKLATLNRFQELNLHGIKLSKPVVDCLCQLAKHGCLSGLLLGNTNIGTECAIQLIKPLSKDTQELVRLDLSFCGLTSDYIVGLRDEASLISGILELNLGGNPIMKEGCSELASLLRNPQCCLRVLVVSKCELGLVGLICMLQALSQNCSLEELILADNISPNEIQALTDNSGLVEQNSNSLQGEFNQPKSSLHALAPDGVETLPQEMCGLNTNENQLEVADSEDDDQVGVEVTLSATVGSQIRTPPSRICLSECQSMQELIASIKMAGNLKMLDLSQNGFPREVTELLFSAWSSGPRASVADSHVDGNIVHFSVQGNKCCSVKSCCRKI